MDKKITYPSTMSIAAITNALIIIGTSFDKQR